MVHPLWIILLVILRLFGGASLTTIQDAAALLSRAGKRGDLIAKAQHSYGGQELATIENERNAQTIGTLNCRLVTCAQPAGLIARRIPRDVKVGESLKKTWRYRFTRFGSREDVYLPLAAMAKVAFGEKASATGPILEE